MNNHPKKEYFENEPQAEELMEIMESNNEPVAWLINGYLSDKEFRTSELDVIIPLYTHPAKTLTDEEILEVAKEMGWRGALGFLVRFARAILLKAQEK